MTHRLALALALTLLAAGPAAAKKPPRPAPEKPSGPAAPSATLLMADGPFDSTFPVPPLSGPDPSLDITQMQRRTIRYTLSLPDVDLSPVSAEQEAGLRRALAMDPRWRLGGEPGARIATARAGTSGWSSGWRGWSVSPTADDALVAILIDPGAVEGQVKAVPTGTPKVELAPWGVPDGPWRGRFATGLRIDGDGLSWQVIEAGPAEHRNATSRALEWSGEWLSEALTMADLVLTEGPDAWPLPAGAIAAPAPPSLTALAPGRVRLTARVNPGEEGWTWLRLLIGGEPWEEAAVAAGTREVVGWSDDPAEGFWMEGAFAIPPGPATPATAELWFSPNGGAPRRLGSWPVDLPTR